LHHKPGKLSTKPDALSRRPDHFKSDADDNQARVIFKEPIKIMASKRGHAMVTNEKPLVQQIKKIQSMEDNVHKAVSQIKNLGP